MKGLQSVLGALEEAHLTLRPSKCVFAAREIEFLGFRLSADGLSPGVAKTTAIDEFTAPENVHEVRRFMGLVSFFRRFITKFAVLARPITELTKKDSVFKWGEAEQKGFSVLKQSITTVPVIQLFDPSRHTEFNTNASCIGVAAILLQRGSYTQMHLVYCISKKIRFTKMTYHSTKLELMAIV